MRNSPENEVILVVGSGPAGATCARMLTDGGRRVLMIDAGPRLTEQPGSHVRNIGDEQARKHAQIASQGPTRFNYKVPAMDERASATARGTYELQHLVRPGTHLLNDGVTWGDLPAAACSTNIGGMGAHWTCACPRPAGSEVIDFINPDEMAHAFEAAEGLLKVSPYAYPESELSKQLLATLDKTFDSITQDSKPIQRMPLACQYENGRRTWSGSNTILGEASATPENRKNLLEIRHSTLCSRLIYQDGRVSSALLNDLENGQSYEVKVSKVIVAADALRTPQLLWASGIRPYALGRFLNDQPQVVHAVRLSTDALGVTQPGDEATVGVYWVPFNDTQHPFHGQIMQLEACPVALPDTTASKVEHIVALGWFCAKQDIRAEDRIHFSEAETDFFGLPKMIIDYKLTERDQAQVSRAKEQVKLAGLRLGTPLSDEPVMLPPGSSLHYQGSTRMGAENDGQSVCDAYAKVWGFSNLFVAGNGVIPTPTACNPTLTSVALATRTCQYILEMTD